MTVSVQSIIYRAAIYFCIGFDINKILIYKYKFFFGIVDLHFLHGSPNVEVHTLKLTLKKQPEQIQHDVISRYKGNMLILLHVHRVLI